MSDYEMEKRINNSLEIFIKKSNLCMTSEEKLIIKHAYINGAKVGIEIANEILNTNLGK